MGERQKTSREKKIFEEFARAVRLPIVPGSIRVVKPPKPDISCRIANQVHYFELREVTDEGLARRRSMAIKERKITGGAFSQEHPLLSSILSKAHKNYLLGKCPLELLLYYDKQYPPPDPTRFVEQRIVSVAKNMKLFGRWTRFWVYDTWNQRLIWVFPKQG